MMTCPSERNHGIQWIARNHSEDLDFADHLNLLSHTHRQTQIKRTSVAAASSSVSFNSERKKRHPQIQQREHQPNHT
ncbi:unnamed protein product [Schistosoma margrebowiei]|uniref:Uncharacterized protein n=1 Tax=Schistosoma margrebowiei TaxID=48269 RepID=A0A183LGV7_9TREM|nr:unnamed protein product [Schistosoma margrebowiei]